MAFTSRSIIQNEATAAFRTVIFGVYNTDGTPKTDLAASTARIYENGAFLADSTNNFAHVDNGRYSLVLTQAEVNTAPLTHLFIAPANAAGYNVVGAEVVIVSPTVDAHVVSMAPNTVTASALAADAVTEIQTGLATAAAVATVDARLDTEIPAILAAVDTEVAAIKAVTDTLSLPAIGQELLLALAMGRGNRIELQGNELVLFGTDGTTEVSRQPFTRLPAPANPTATIG